MSYAMAKRRALTARHHFALLGVHLGCSAQELAVARRALAKIFHPDINGDPAAADIMARINAACSVLEDEKQRAVYAKCIGPKCGACDGRGYKQKQKGFSKTVVTICNSCEGAGHVDKL